MIPIELQDRLVERFESEFENLRLKDLKDDLVKVNIFPQHLPTKSKNGTSHYPCIIIRLANGDKAEATDPFITRIQFIVGVIDRESVNQGYRDALSVVNRIIESIQRNPSELDTYEATPNVSWSYYDEDTEPYFFAGLETSWRTPSYIREDVEDLI